jgi:L-lactate dehydrogenase complex protein LldF
LINRLRAEAVQGVRGAVPLSGRRSLRKAREAGAWKLWCGLYTRPRLYRLFTLVVTRLRWLAPARLGGWTRYRIAPRPAERALRELACREGFRVE